MTQTTLPEGNEIRYQYDEGNLHRFQQGNLLSETRIPDASRGGDQTAITTTYTYEPIYNHVQTMTEPRGNDPSYVPQNGGPQSAARYTTTYTYDAAGNMLEMQRPTVTLPGNTQQPIVTNYTYNSFGQMTSMTDPEGNVTQYQYCPASEPSCTGPPYSGGGYLQETITDATTSPGRTESTSPAQITTQYLYDGIGNVVQTVDGRGNTTLYTYNALNQQVEMQSQAPFRYTTYTYYDANDNIIQRSVENQVPTTTDDKPSFSGGNFATADGSYPYFVTRYTYDILDKMVTDTEDATGSTPSTDVTQYRYDADGNRIQVTQPFGNVTAYKYDERNLLYTETRGSGSATPSTTTSNYDLNGNLATSVNGRGFITTYQYDGFDRQTILIDAVGGQTASHYDDAGNVVSQTRSGQPGGASPTNSLGTGNVLLRSQTSEYDELSRRYQIDDLPVNGSSFVANGVTTSRPPSETTGPLNPGDISTQAIYDRNGRIVERIDDDLNTTSTQYDGVNRPVLRTDPQGNLVQTTYDADSNVIQTVETDVSEKSGVNNETITTTYQYDSLNRRTISTDNCGNTRQWAYDSRNNLTNTTDAKGDNTAGCPMTGNPQGNTTSYTYDGQNRLLTSVQDLRTGGVGSGAVDTTNSYNPSGQIVVTYAYDANGRTASMTDNNGDTTQYAYDALDRMISETLADGSLTKYTFDTDNNVVTVTDNNGSVQTHTYDDIDRLTKTSVTRATGVVGTTANTYQYDGLNRPTLLTDNNNTSDATSASTVTMAYDSLGRIVEETQNGHAVDAAWYAQVQRSGLTYPSGRQLNYTYDALERMATVQDNGASSNIAKYT
jgi:YD repeat-containing protein